MDSFTDARQIIIHELKIPPKYLKQSSKFDRVEALVHRTWLRHILNNWSIPEEFPQHEQLQPEEISAWFKQRENFGPNWQHIVIKVLKKSSTTVIPLPKTKKSTKPETELSFSQILHYVGQTNHKNLWKEAFKKYSYAYLPSHSDHRTQDRSKIQLTDSTNVLREVIIRTYGHHMISIDGKTMPQTENESTFETHPNLLSASVVLEMDRYFLLFYEDSLDYTLQDCVSFSPAILTGSYSKPLFIIYQLLKLMRYLHDHGLALGDITLADIQLSEDLWIQVLPHLEANIYNIPKPVEKRPPTPVVEEKSKEDKSIDVGNLCTAWVQGAMSNFDYLTALNNLARRRYGDPRSHHVFPWITDFTSHNGANWRDLSKSKFRLNKGDRQLDLTYELPPNCNAAQVPHHVSDVLSEITYYVYLARITPKPILCKYVRPQWVPAEYPSSIQRLQQWTPDECIPEFFTDPDVFKSIHPDLPDLELPSWTSSAEEFVRQHRASLESNHVSERLHFWIDLTFGYKLSGMAAVKSKNVCLQLVDGHTQLTDIGVVQLFTQPHPHRLGPSIYWGITPPRLHHNMHRDRRKVGSDDEDAHSSMDEEENVTNTSGNTPRSSPLPLSRLLSRPRSSLPINSLTPSSPSSESQQTAATSEKPCSSNASIVLPQDYNPVAGLVALENLHNFMHKTYHTKHKGCENNSYSEMAAYKQVVAARRVQEMQVLGCLIVEMFLASKLRVFGCGLEPISFTQRFQICRNLLQTSSINRDQIPRCVRNLVMLLLQIDVASETESVHGVPFRYPTVTSYGIPPPSAHQLLQPNLTSSLLPFPSNFPTVYSMVKTLKEYSLAVSELKRIRLEKYSDNDARRESVTRTIEKLSEWKVKSIAQNLENLVEDSSCGSTTIGWMDLVVPHVLNMLLDPDTSVLTAWHLFDPIARALGPNRTTTLFLEPMVRLFDCEFEKDSVLQEVSPNCLKKRIKIYHRSFLLRLMVRFRMKVFLDNFIPPLVEGVGGYQDIETNSSEENMELRAEMRENTSLLDCSEVEEATEWTGESVLSPLEEDSSADSDKNHSSTAVTPAVVEQNIPVAEPEVFVLEPEGSVEDDDLEQSKQNETKIKSLLLDNLEIQTEDANSSSNSPSRSSIVNIPSRSKAGDSDSWSFKSESLNCQFEEKGKKNDFEYSKVSEVSADSVIWLMHRLGPVLTARHLSRNLLRMLSLCYVGENCHQQTGNDIAKLIGDNNAAKVLDCLTSIAVVYGEQLIILQYLPHVTDLIVLCKKKCTSNLEAGLIASLALLKHCIEYLTDETISELLQDTLLKQIIHPCLRLLSSTKQVFPGGVAARNAIATKLVECLYLLALRVGTEQRIVLVHTLQRFYLVFSKARRQKNEDLGPSRGGSGGEMSSVPRVRDYDSTDSCSPPKTSSSGIDGESYKTKALEELYLVMSPQLAYWTFKSFANFFGETFMEQSLKNHSLIQELCSEYTKEQELLGTPVLGDQLLSGSESLPNCDQTHGATAVVVGNRIELQEPIAVKSSSPNIPSSSGQVLNKHMENNSRHLRGNWLAYWEHEIGRSGKDSHFNVKQIKLQSFSGHNNSVRVITVLDNENSFLSASRDKTVKVWSLRSKGDGNTVSGCQWTYTGHRKSVMALGFVERVRLVVSCDSTVHLWDPFIGRIVSQADVRGSPVNTLRPLNPPSAAVLTANTDATLRTFDARIGSYVNELKVVASGAGLIRCISVSPGGTLVALGQASGYLTLLDLRTGTVLSSWKGHEGEVLQLIAVNEQTVVSSSLDQAISAWSTNEGKLRFNLKGATEPVHCLDTYCSELISGTTANRIGVHSGIEASASFSTTKLRTETFKGVLTALTVLPLNRLLLLGADTGGITLLC